jgi:hypothetical protein
MCQPELWRFFAKRPSRTRLSVAHEVNRAAMSKAPKSAHREFMKLARMVLEVG